MIKSTMEEIKAAYLHMIHDKDVEIKVANKTLSMSRETKAEVGELTIEINSTS